jgi:hypothetical protein
VRRESIERVLRARRVEAASRRKVDRDQAPGADGEHECPSDHRWSALVRGCGCGDGGHRSNSRDARRSSRNAASMVENGACSTRRSAPKRYAEPESRSCSYRAIAPRRRRRMRFRTTAFPVALVMVYATRGPGAPGPATSRGDAASGTGFAAHRSQIGPDRSRRARPRTSKVARSRTGRIRPTDASGRGRDALAGPRDRPWCACAGGSRASSCAYGCWADTYASRRASSGNRAVSVSGVRGVGPRGRRGMDQCTGGRRRNAMRGVPAVSIHRIHPSRRPFPRGW